MPRAIATVLRTRPTGTVSEVDLAITQDPEFAPKLGENGAPGEVNKDAIHGPALAGFEHGRVSMTVSNTVEFQPGQRFRLIFEPL